MKIVSVVGKKNSGKTSLTTKIIKELTKRDYNVASIKHSHHTMEMDKENTDTWRHKQAGANVVVGIGTTTFFNVKKDMDLERLLFLIKHLDDIDYVIIEGFKKYNYPKIITSADVKDEYTIAEVDSFKIDDEGIEKLADLIEKKGHDIIDTLYANTCGYNDGEVIASKIREGELKTSDLDKTHSYLSIDGKVVGLNNFVSNYLKQSVSGIINTLNLKEFEVDEIKNIELLIPDCELKERSNSIEVMINNKNLKINKFTSNLLSNSITAMIESLKTPENYKTTDIVITDEDIDVKLDGNTLDLNNFSKKILNQTITSQISALKTESEIKEIKIKIE